jgi:hypothetical protein
VRLGSKHRHLAEKLPAECHKKPFVLACMIKLSEVTDNLGGLEEVGLERNGLTGSVPTTLCPCCSSTKFTLTATRLCVLVATSANCNLISVCFCSLVECNKDD